MTLSNRKWTQSWPLLANFVISYLFFFAGLFIIHFLCGKKYSFGWVGYSFSENYAHKENFENISVITSIYWSKYTKGKTTVAGEYICLLNVYEHPRILGILYRRCQSFTRGGKNTKLPVEREKLHPVVVVFFLLEFIALIMRIMLLLNVLYEILVTRNHVFFYNFFKK